MAKLRHIAFIVEDPDAAAAFFTAAFGMKRTAEARVGCHMSDGVISIALLRRETEDERIGLDHFGMWVDDLGEAQERAVAAGAILLGERAAGSGAFGEVKLRTADGVIFDLSEEGWPGASR